MDLSTEAVCTNLEKKRGLKNREMKAGIFISDVSHYDFTTFFKFVKRKQEYYNIRKTF